MAGSYKDLEKEFRGMDKEYRDYLGLLGLRHVVNETADALERRSSPQRPRMDESFDPIGRYKNNMDDSLNNYGSDQMETDLSQETIISLVDRMRLTTFKFKITNAFEEIITPLRAEMERISLEEGQMKLKHHTEDNLYQQAIIDSLKDMSKSVEGNLIRSMVMEYQRFTRHPVWSSLRYLNAGLIQPVASSIKTILFGWKKEKSDTDRIVEAINELTEFMMTGQIDKTESFMDKYIRKGLLQSMGERVLGLGGYDRSGAQRIEDMRASGQGWRIDQVLNKHRAGGTGALTDEERQIHKDLISSKIFSSIIKRGRLSPVGGSEEGGRIIDITPYQADMKSLVEKVAMYTESIAKSNSMLLLSTTECGGCFTMEDFFRNYERVTQTVMESVSVGQADMITHSVSTFSNNIAKQHKEQMEMSELLLESSESVEKHTKDTARRTRRGFGSLLGIIGVTLVGAIAKLGTAGLGLMGVGAGAGLAANAKKLAKRIPLLAGAYEIYNERQSILEEFIKSFEANQDMPDYARNITATIDMIKKSSQEGFEGIANGFLSIFTVTADYFTKNKFDFHGMQQDLIASIKEYVNPFADVKWLIKKWVEGTDPAKIKEQGLKRLETVSDIDPVTGASISATRKRESDLMIEQQQQRNREINMQRDLRAFGISLENTDSMHDVMNYLHTPVTKKQEARPVYESPENLTNTTNKVMEQLSNGIKSSADRQIEINNELLESLGTLRKEIKIMGDKFNEGNKDGSGTTPYVFDSDALLNKLGL